FLSHGLNVGLGSDSVASNNTCDILEEARFATLLARLSEPPAVRGPREGIPSGVQDAGGPGRNPGGTCPAMSGEQALFAATLGGARALGLDGQIGALAVGMSADLTVVDLRFAHQQPNTLPEDVIIFSSSGRDVICTMVSGKEVYRAGHVNAVAEADFIQRLR